MKILVTGSNGQVGSCLARQLSQMSEIEFLAVNREQLDITDGAAVTNLVNYFKPDVIINAAAYTEVDKAEQEVDLAYSINRDGPLLLAQAADAIGASMLHISTDYVFEGNKLGEYAETDATNPQGVYGASKLAGEMAVAQACDKHIILRTAWVFGENGNNFVKTMLRLGATCDALNIVGDQFGGPTYAGDIAEALIQIAKRIEQDNSIEFGIFHFSGLPHVSWYEFAKTIFDTAVDQGLSNKKPSLTSITTEQYPTPAKRPSNSRLSTDKINKAFSIEASDWKVALKNIQAYTG